MLIQSQWRFFSFLVVPVFLPFFAHFSHFSFIVSSVFIFVFFCSCYLFVLPSLQNVVCLSHTLSLNLITNFSHNQLAHSFHFNHYHRWVIYLTQFLQLAPGMHVFWFVFNSRNFSAIRSHFYPYSMSLTSLHLTQPLFFPLPFWALPFVWI